MKQQISQLLDDEGAVSPVIGVILMVAITVILAAVIGTFVLGLGDQVSQTAPQASFSVESASTSSITLSHGGGDSIDSGETRIVFDGASSGSLDPTDGETLEPAETLEITDSSTTVSWGGNDVNHGGTAPTLGSGDSTITLVDSPSGQIIAEKEFSA